MKTLYFLLLPILLCSGCFTYQKPSQQTNYSKVFLEKYANRIEEGSEIIRAGYHYSVEKAKDGHYIQKTYFPETGQITHYFTYTDMQLNLKDGKATEWWDNANKYQEGIYKNNEREGLWQFYSFSSGKLTGSGTYINGKQEGIWKSFADSTGLLSAEYTYKSNKREGLFKEYDKKGNLMRQGEYADDEVVKEETLIASTEGGKDSKAPEVMPSANFAICNNIADPSERQNCGTQQLLKFIAENIRYPAFARENEIEGKALTQFTVEKDGSISNIRVMRGLCQSIKTECERVVRAMPKWNPGMQDGKPVRVWFTLPIAFRLE